MRLARLHVQNLRSIVDSGEFPVQPLLGLVGENNAGKSNLLKAIDVLLSGGVGRLGKDDFTDPNQPLIIKGWFEALTVGERRRWKPYLIGDQLILEKRLAFVADETDGKQKISVEFHGYRAEPSLTYLAISKILQKYGERPKWGEIVAEAGLPDYFFVDGKCTKAEYAKGLERYLFENDVDFDPPDVSSTQALGLRSNVTANLPSVYLLPAITDYSEEIDRRSSSSTFRRLMADLSERILEQDPRFAELDLAVETIRGLLNRVDQASAPKRFDALESIEVQIGDRLRRLMPSVRGVAMQVEVQGFRDLFSGGVSLIVDDGVETDVLAKGHGLQRCIVFALLQTLILNERSRPAANPEVATLPEHAILLLIEEPELYIHPQLGKLFFDVMREFSKTDQVIYSTHSPLFIDAYESQQIALVCKPSIAEGTRVHSCDASAFTGLTDRSVFKGLASLNPAVNELFFARRVLLVEGAEDLIAVTAVLQKAGRIRQRVEEIDWSVIPCGGKQSIPFFQRVLNAFDIPYRVLHDADLDPDMSNDSRNMAIKQNEAIQVLAAGRPVHTYPRRLEQSLGHADHFRDQFDAHSYLLDPAKITPEVESIVLAAVS